MALVRIIPRIKVDGIVYARDQIVEFPEDRAAALAAEGYGEIKATAPVWTEHAQRVSSEPPAGDTPMLEPLETLEDVAADQPPPPADQPGFFQRLFGG